MTVSDLSGTQKAVPLPKGTLVVIHVPGLHYNRAKSSVDTICDSLTVL